MEGLDIVGLGLTVLDVLMRLKEMPNWERGGRISGFALDGGGPAGTATVAAARLGARTGFVGTAG
ncbi:MAG: sugar kinase, partial [Anaerolineae bacterium]|nr:sugar kinase [Anaerolineae bacterium]